MKTLLEMTWLNRFPLSDWKLKKPRTFDHRKEKRKNVPHPFAFVPGYFKSNGKTEIPRL